MWFNIKKIKRYFATQGKRGPVRVIYTVSSCGQWFAHCGLGCTDMDLRATRKRGVLETQN